MYDVAIAGGGLCGLAVAQALEREGLGMVLIEARERLGGRILTEASSRNGLPMDLGATWFWPAAQPLLRDKLRQLGLQGFVQHDSGRVLGLIDPDRGPEDFGTDPVHGGAFRIAGGAGALIDALAGQLTSTEVRLGARLLAVRDEGDHLRLHVAAEGGMCEVEARQLVLALPPRLVAADIGFSPALPDEVLTELARLPTWMAASAKAVSGQGGCGWRAAGLSGSAFVTHEQAVLAEVFDACDAAGARAALGGFLCLSPATRHDFAAGLPMLIGNQLAQVFGPGVETGELHYRDWADEPYTCDATGRASPRDSHPRLAAPILRQPHWGGRLHFAGAETASREPGYMEGALDAAARAERAVILQVTRAAANVSAANAEGIATFHAWVEGQRAAALAVYERRVRERLTRHQRDQLTQRALLETIEGVFAAALDQIAGLALDPRGVPVERGRSALTPLIQEPFRAFLSALIDDVLRSNGASCALSNFAAEHQPSKAYVQAILRDIAAAWAQFSQAANALLTGAATARDGAAPGEG